MAEELQDLIRVRASLKSKLTIFRKFIDGYDSNPQPHGLQLRYDTFKKELTRFESIQSSIEKLSTDYDKELKDREEFEDRSLTYIAKAKSMIKNNSMNQVTDDATIVPQNSMTPSGLGVQAPYNAAKINFPKLELPKFDGSVKEWPSFADSFRSSVHNDSRFDEVQKLTYLRSCLTGKARKKIESLPTTDNNYKVAWDILENAYHDPNFLINKHVRAFFELPRYDKTNTNALGDIGDTIRTHLRALQALKVPFLESFPIHCVTSVLDKETERKWNEKCMADPSLRLENLLDFIESKQKLIDRVIRKKDNNKNLHLQKQKNKRGPSATVMSAQIKMYCHNCKGNHYTQHCDEFLKLSIDERYKLIKIKKLCYNCLRSNHITKDCRSGGCKTCNGKHHTLLHKNEQQTNLANLKADSSNQVLLCTALVNFTDNDGKSHQARVLLDSCSQVNFLSKKLAKRLKLPEHGVNVKVNGINNLSNIYTREIDATIQSIDNRFKTKLPFLIRDHFPEIISSFHINVSELDLPTNIYLADPKFYEPSTIDALLGAKVFFKLMCMKQKYLKFPDAMLQKTRLGWIVAGSVPIVTYTAPVICNIATGDLNKQLERFWEIEHLPDDKLLSEEENYCEKHFIENTTRDSQSGRYIVKLPFKSTKSKLGESYDHALKRFYALECTLNKNSELKSQYTQFLREYESLGHMTKCKPNREICYLPHHGVIKHSSRTTKLRVVFDASAKTTTGISLNDILHVGPVIQDDLFSILLRFRLHAYVLTADIEKMYRQIYLHIEDRSYQNILWRENNDSTINAYRLNTVTYGTASASFLATRTLHQLARDEGKLFPNAASVLKRDFYMDDLLTGTSTIKEAEILRDELLKITEKAKLPLRQWASNDAQLINNLGADLGKSHISLTIDDTIKTLGVYWHAKNDSITYTVNKSIESQITKRTILSQISKLFDPLGLLGPVIIYAKMLMQRLWKIRISWDTPLPADIKSAWIRYYDDLSMLDQMRVPRKVIMNDYLSIELHGFCDASERAYGACIFIKTINVNKDSHTQLLCAKSKVTPLKSLSIPRLELCAALLLSKLFASVMLALRNIKFERVIFWSDSTITLNWVLTPPHTLKTFVSNRVAMIQEITSIGEWRHVPSSQNPADLITRGLTPSELISNKLWLSGPTWLNKDEKKWPDARINIISNVPEVKAVSSFVTLVEKSDMLTRYSSFKKLKKVTALCLRFINNTRKLSNIKELPLRPEEIKRATTCIIKLVQKECFKNEINSLKSTRELEANIACLSPFIDNDDVLRVGGRLRHADLPYDQKHQALLPRHHYITDLIIREIHENNFHACVQTTLNDLREAYWVVNARQYLKGIIYKCVTCRKFKPKIPDYLMADLPKDRVNCARPFLHTGIDLCGPFSVKEKRLRNRKALKIYISVFVCFSTKAIYLELVEDLSSEAFLAALKRFSARRGKPATIYSDNATNFTGVKRHLDEITSFLTNKKALENIKNELANEGTEWQFIPPRAPHFGGLWEAAVKSIKRHLLPQIKNVLLSYEALLTLTCEIEAILNSRPLTPLSSDPNNFNALTPGHFIIGQPMRSILPGLNLEPTLSSSLCNYKQTQQIRRHFWDRWKREYLHTLTVRQKWHKGSTRNITIGSLVILQDNNLPPLKWPMARIIATHPGDDGVVRTVTVKTVNGEYKRAVKCLSPLPIEE